MTNVAEQTKENSHGKRSSKSLRGLDESEVTFLGTKNLQPGMVIDGIFEKSAVIGQYDTLTFFIRKEDGSKVGINKLGNLGYLFRELNVEEGEHVNISYLGMVPNRKTGQEFHTFEMEVGA